MVNLKTALVFMIPLLQHAIALCNNTSMRMNATTFEKRPSSPISKMRIITRLVASSIIFYMPYARIVVIVCRWAAGVRIIQPFYSCTRIRSQLYGTRTVVIALRMLCSMFVGCYRMWNISQTLAMTICHYSRRVRN